MKKISIIYGSSTDNTKAAAEQIAALLTEHAPEVLNVADCNADSFTSADFLILGTSTWGCGDLQDDWADMLDRLKGVDLSGKRVALFGLGDSSSFSDTFVDGMGELYEFFRDKNCQIFGSVSSDGYSFDASRALVDDEFVGLPLDSDNEDHLTQERISAWMKNLKPSL